MHRMGLRHADLYGAIFSASPGGGYRPPVAPATDRDGTTACCDGPAFESFGARKVSSGPSTLPDWGWRET